MTERCNTPGRTENGRRPSEAGDSSVPTGGRTLSRPALMRKKAVGALAVAVAAGVVLVSNAGSTPLGNAPVPIEISASSDAAVVAVHRDGRTCDAGGEGSAWRGRMAAPIDGLVAGNDARLSMDLTVRSELVDPQGGVDPHAAVVDPVGPPAGHLDPGAIGAITDDRGTLKLAVTPGDCDSADLAFDGVNAVGAATWSVERGTGAYAGVTGGGSVELALETRPGADNHWSAAISGDLVAPQPELALEPLDSWWGNHGLDYLLRRVTVSVRVRNVGDGWAFRPTLVNVSSDSVGVVALGPGDTDLGPLPPGGYVDVALRYALGPFQPCGPIVRSCEFEARADVSWEDVLGTPSSDSAVTTVETPEGAL